MRAQTLIPIALLGGVATWALLKSADKKSPPRTAAGSFAAAKLRTARDQLTEGGACCVGCAYGRGCEGGA